MGEWLRLIGSRVFTGRADETVMYNAAIAAQLGRDVVLFVVISRQLGGLTGRF